jgi:hypothetical protein
LNYDNLTAILTADEAQQQISERTRVAPEGKKLVILDGYLT